MNGLALCAGIGGLELGIKLALPTYKTVCWVENDPDCQRFIIQRFGNGLDEAPIWDDLTTFDGRAWRGKVDLISAGFPCQPFSSAGQRKGVLDPRYLWPQLDRIIGEVSPNLVFLENVRWTAFREAVPCLIRLGYEVRAGTFASAEVGAGHLRRRCFVLAYLDGQGKLQQKGRKFSIGERTCYFGWRTTEPSVARVVHGLPDRVAQERALGNAVDPWVARLAFRTLAGLVDLEPS